MRMSGVFERLSYMCSSSGFVPSMCSMRRIPSGWWRLDSISAMAPGGGRLTKFRMCVGLFMVVCPVPVGTKILWVNPEVSVPGW